MPESCSNFLYVFKAALNGPLTPPTGHELGPAAVLWPELVERPSAGGQGGQPWAAADGRRGMGR